MQLDSIVGKTQHRTEARLLAAKCLHLEHKNTNRVWLQLAFRCLCALQVLAQGIW